MTVGSLFAGIGGFDLGFTRAGCEVRWQIEIDPHCVKVLTHRWPSVTRFADVNALVYGRATNRVRHGLVLEPVDILCGGFPCQDVSIAGKRKGLAGARTGLFFAFMRAVRLVKPRWVVIENVPGLLTSHGGRDFHTVLAALAECGMRRSYRILDSQYFGLAQRRDRVFLVGGARTSGHDPAAVLFESARGGGHSATGGATRARVAATLRGRSHGAGVNAPGRGGEDDDNLITATLRAHKQSEDDLNLIGPLGGGNDGIGRRTEDDPNLVLVAATLNSGGNSGGFRTEPGAHLVLSGERARALVSSMFKRHDDDTDTLICATETGQGWWTEGLPAIRAQGGGTPQQLIASAVTSSAGHHGHSSPRGDGSDNLVTFALGSHSGTADGEQTNASHANGGPVGLGISEEVSHSLVAGRTQSVAYALRADPGGIGQGHNTTFPNGVRRLTPLECERLQGFPDGWTCLCGEGHRGSQFCRCPDSARYKALGNAVSVPVAEWIARRIRAADEERLTR